MLAVIVLCGCGGGQQVAVENRGGAASTGCELPARLEFEARRYGNVDADDPDYQVWSSWRVGIQLATRSDHARLRGTLAMSGDELTWTFDVAGTLARCHLDLVTDSHEPVSVDIDLVKRTGIIRSIDDVWLLGPPFPSKR